MGLFIMQFSPASSSTFGPNIILRTVNETDKVSLPYKTTGTIIFLKT